MYAYINTLHSANPRKTGVWGLCSCSDLFPNNAYITNKLHDFKTSEIKKQKSAGIFKTSSE